MGEQWPTTFATTASTAGANLSFDHALQFHTHYKQKYIQGGLKQKYIEGGLKYKYIQGGLKYKYIQGGFKYKYI